MAVYGVPLTLSQADEQMHVRRARLLKKNAAAHFSAQPLLLS
jgi:hypothetical protein